MVSRRKPKVTGKMNEETQELDGSLQTIGGDVYDLTNGKVSIMLDPD